MHREIVKRQTERYEALITRKNRKTDFYNGIFDRYEFPVLTREHAPLFWKYDFNEQTNPYFMERLGINATFNSGAMFYDGKYLLCVRVEGLDRKSFFAFAQSDSPVEGFRFRDKPILLPDTVPEETNVYDMRLTIHEDGWIYGIFCSESKDPDAPEGDLSSAVAAAGIVRTKDLESWERLPNLKTVSPQQRNVILHPEFVDGKYALYTRPMDGFIETGKGSGICYGLCDDIANASIKTEELVNPRIYHTITEAKNGGGAVPIKTPEGWLHIVHGVRNTAAGLRYVIYAFMTSLEDPKIPTYTPGGYLIAPIGPERIGDVSNVVFTNGAIVAGEDVYIYYGASDTRLNVVSTTLGRLVDYMVNTPSDPLRSADCVKQRIELIDRNLEIMKHQ